MAEISPHEFLERIKSGASFERADLSGLQLEGAILPKAKLARADLSGANLAGADLRGANLSSVSLREAYLPGALLEGAKLKNADLEGANLSHADLLGADLQRANFEGANLEGAKLRGAKLLNAVFTDANLGKAELEHASLRNAELADAYLGGANLRQTDLRKATLEGTNLEEADLTGADLREADLTQAVLDGATLDGAKVHGLVVAIEQLAKAKIAWLDVSRGADGSAREEGAMIGRFLSEAGAGAALAATMPQLGAAPAAAPAVEPGVRYFGPGDVLRHADLAFGAGSSVQVEGRFEECTLTLGDAARLRIGKSGVVRSCKILGTGIVLVDGELLNEGPDGPPVTSKVFAVSAGGRAATTIVQPESLTRFGFEPGCVLELVIRR